MAPERETGLDDAAEGPGEDAEAPSRGRPGLTQDPHRVREISERNLETAIGREVRSHRRAQGMTVADLAAATGLSIGMLSKIENGVTSPSLATLQALSHAFSCPLTAFFRGFEERREVQHVRAGEHLETERRGTRAGHQYHLLGHIGANGSGVVMEPYLITLTTESDVFPTFQHDGIELLFMLEGEVTYRHGSTCGPAIRCCSTPMRGTGRRCWTGSPPAT
jgi:transcriptional regulator with XRE-family HTH domain